MTVLYVASDREGAGKTALCAALARAMERQGREVVVFKPVAGIGLSSDSDPDVGIYGKLLDQRTEGWLVDLSEGGLAPGSLTEIRAAFSRVAEGADVVLVEGSCALSIEESGEVAGTLGAKVLFIAPYSRDLSTSQLKRYKELIGDRLLGFVINGLTRYLGTDARTNLLPSMESEGLVCFGIVPEDRRLLGVTVGQLAEHLKGQFIARNGDTDVLVEHLMVGGRGMDPGDLYFGLRESKAVIVRGDRPDSQMAALQTPTSCMVLTGGIAPIEYVKYEAEQQEVSIMVVETDTLTTMEALNTLIDRARFDHPAKLSRFGELVEQHVDLGALFTALALV